MWVNCFLYLMIVIKHGRPLFQNSYLFKKLQCGILSGPETGRSFRATFWFVFTKPRPTASGPMYWDYLGRILNWRLREGALFLELSGISHSKSDNDCWLVRGHLLYQHHHQSPLQEALCKVWWQSRYIRIRISVSGSSTSNATKRAVKLHFQVLSYFHSSKHDLLSGGGELWEVLQV